MLHCKIIAARTVVIVLKWEFDNSYFSMGGVYWVAIHRISYLLMNETGKTTLSASVESIDPE